MAIDSYAIGVILVVSGVVLSVLGLMFTRQALDLRKLEQSHEVSG